MAYTRAFKSKVWNIGETYFNIDSNLDSVTSSDFKACCILEGWDCCRKTSAPRNDIRFRHRHLGFSGLIPLVLLNISGVSGHHHLKKKIRILSYHHHIVSYIISYMISYIISSYLNLVSYFQLSQEVTSLLHLLSLHRENCQQNNLRLCQENGKVFYHNSCHHCSTPQKKNRGSVCFFLNLEGFKDQNMQNHEKSFTLTSKHQKTTVIYNQIFQVTLMSSTHVCLLVIRVYLIGPSFVTFQECFRPHVISLGHLALQALWPSVIEPICLQKWRKISRFVPKFGIYPRHVISRILLKPQDFDAIDAKHCETYRFFRILDALDKLKSLLKGTLNHQTQLALR